MSITTHCGGNSESMAISSGVRLWVKKWEKMEQRKSASIKSVAYLPQTTDLLYS